MYENGFLPGTNDQLRTIFDLVLIAGKTPDECVLRVVDPLDDVDQLISQFVK
jgi:hypothetical protein